MPTTWGPRTYRAPCPATPPWVADAIKLWQALPDPWWTTYGDLATVIKTPGHARALGQSLSAARGPGPSTPPGDTTEWIGPWEKLRTADGRAKSRDASGYLAERAQHDNIILSCCGCPVDASGVADPRWRMPVADLAALWAEVSS